MAAARAAEMVARRIRRELPQHLRWVAMVEMMAHLAERHMGQPTPVQRDVEARTDADGGQQAVDLHSRAATVLR